MMTDLTQTQKNNNQKIFSGPLSKMPAQTYLNKDLNQNLNPSHSIFNIDYYLPLGAQKIKLNDLINSDISLRFNQLITCQACGKSLKKAYQQGFCYVATQKLAQCDMCILKPEQCHHHLGTCREPDWGLKHCFNDHVIYLANSSGVKVGITRAQNIPSRWIDQGAEFGLPIIRVSNRLLSGQIEVLCKAVVNDKTHWQKMLKGPSPEADLFEIRQKVLDHVQPDLELLNSKIINSSEYINIIPESELKLYQFQYPIIKYLEKIKSFNFDKTPEISGKLLGIKGQYLILDTGVLNIRKFSGYQIDFTFDKNLDPEIKPLLEVYPYQNMPPCD